MLIFCLLTWCSKLFLLTETCHERSAVTGRVMGDTSGGRERGERGGERGGDWDRERERLLMSDGKEGHR